MKKLFFLLLVVSSFYFFISCDSETSDTELEPQVIETVKPNQVFFSGELQSKNPNVSSNSFRCGVTGAECAFPNQTLTYTYSGSNNVTWTVNSGSISISNGQGTNTVSLKFSSNFTGGVVTATNSESPDCTVILEILKCKIVPPPPTCGINVNGIYELNLLGDRNVVFYTIPDVDSGWRITGSSFTVTYQDGDTSYHTGYTNNQGYQQIKIPVSCSNKVRKVEVTVYGKNNSNVSCSDKTTHNWGTIGVCGTSDFN